MTALLDDVAALARSAADVYAGTPAEGTLREVVDRLAGPLRVAIAGRVKAGKSTLLNALVGQELAPTDAGECTRVVTWYRDGITYRATLYPREGRPEDVAVSRPDGGAIVVDLGGHPPEDVERLVVDWPSASLREMTLIDTPGIASLTASASDAALAFLTPGEDQPTPADAVLYLMRHVHSTDVRFLEAFHDEEVAQATPINAVGVLSRADEVGVGRLDAMASAQRIASRYRKEPRLRRLCQTIVPVAALVAQAGATLREDEFRALGRIAEAPRDEAEALLLSTDRFVRGDEAAGLTAAEREALLARLGLFGVRVSVALIRQKAAGSAGDLAEALVGKSGMNELRAVLVSQLASRRDVLKARSALLAVEAVVRSLPLAGTERLAADLERIHAGAHEFAEVRLLNALRAGAVGLKEDEAAAAERLLGAEGTDPHERLGLDPDTPPADLRRAVQSSIDRWQRRVESPLSSREAAESARVLVRTCEGLAASLG